MTSEGWWTKPVFLIYICLNTLTGVVDLTTALPSSLCVVTCTWTPGFEESWFSVGGRAGVEDDMVISRLDMCLQQSPMGQMISSGHCEFLP